MERFSRKRLEIVLEAPALNRLTAALDAAGVSGYTVLPVLSGRGEDGHWSREGLVGDAGRMVMVVCITDAGKAEAALARIRTLLSRQIGIVTLGDVEVLRGERF